MPDFYLAVQVFTGFNRFLPAKWFKVLILKDRKLHLLSIFRCQKTPKNGLHSEIKSPTNELPHELPNDLSLEILGNLREVPRMLAVKGKCTIPLENCKKSQKYLFLLSFENLATMFCPRLYT